MEKSHPSTDRWVGLEPTDAVLPYWDVVNKSRLAQIGIPVSIVLVVVMMVVPLPAFMLDMLIAINLTAGVVILLTSMYVKRALDFSVFPALLLVATLFRLALNVSATRLVLTDGYAGKVIEAFGHFVVGG